MAIINNHRDMNLAPFSLNRAETAAAPVVRQRSAGKSIDTPKNDPVLLNTFERTHLALGQRQTINLSLNKAAMSIRIADRTMKTIGKHVSSMKSQLDTIVKHYPPFLTSSPERIRALRSFSAFRKEIEALTLPPQDNGAAKIMADPAVFPQAGNQTIVVGSGASGSLQSRQVHAGPAGLNIPVLSDTATDAEINTAISSLEAAQNTLGQRRAGLSADAVNLLPTGKFTDMVAEHKSVDVGKSIAREPSQAFTGMRPLLLQMA